MRLRTAKQIASDEEPRLPVGARLYRGSAKVKLPSPLVALSGIHRPSGTVYSTRPYGVVAWRQKPQNDPRTSLQVTRREAKTVINRSWHLLDPAARESWGRYALAEGLSHPEMSVNQAGYTQWVRAMTYRLPMTGSLTREAPRQPAPGSVLRVEQIAPPDEESFAFRISHTQQEVTGYRLLVELTPPTESLTRAPAEKALAWYAQRDPDSFDPLQASGSVYILRGARAPVPSGRRFGVRVMLVTEDGVPGPRATEDLIKLRPEAEFEGPEDALVADKPEPSRNRPGAAHPLGLRQTLSRSQGPRRLSPRCRSTAGNPSRVRDIILARRRQLERAVYGVAPRCSRDEQVNCPPSA